MRSAVRMAAVAVITALAACGGSGQTPVARVTPTLVTSPSPEVSPSPVATATPVSGLCDADHHCLALVTIRGSQTVVVRDVTDIDHPTTVSSAIAGQFVSATELSYADATSLYRTRLTGSPKTLVAKTTGGIPLGLFGWSPDGSRAAYMAADGLHVISGGVDQGFGQPLPTASGFGCESQQCADDWDGRLAFSPDGGYISLLVNIGPITGFHLWASDGTLQKVPSTPAPTMSVWSGQTFYFRDANGVEAWRDGVVSSFLPGVQWVRPKGSPAGGAVVYEARDGSGLAHVYVVDTATHKVRELKAGRRDPVFLTSRYVWYAGERVCTLNECAAGGALTTGKTYIYDLQTGMEYDSIITGVYDVWPHAA